ncbi:MAG: hypothetical protein HC934_10580 [Acaryochloridaceae cyanobacterium SU_2_1]|nr:hypothetical protein [Acaryochloridaceae cyanobacterium SU_2_1]
MKLTWFVLVGTAMSLLPATADIAQAQFVFGASAEQVIPIPVVSPYTGYVPYSYPYPGFYNYYFQGAASYNPQYEYSLSENLTYEFPVVGNFRYE